MKKIIERIVLGSGAPNETDLWLNGTTLKKFENGEWKTVGSVNVQPDWEQDDSNAADYIKNKPSLDPICVVTGYSYNNQDHVFVPDEGQISFAEAKNQIESGHPLIIVVRNVSSSPTDFYSIDVHAYYALRYNDPEGKYEIFMYSPSLYEELHWWSE